ncbi:MAG: DNA repair protein [Oscillospiraceae bacterium]|nr:DNA repair protein [Oscillospiraceae bacterium]
MTEKDLRKLNRYQLLELLIMQTERADKLQTKLETTEAQLREQELQLSSLGSIAEASLQLKGVFKAAQDAADMYIAAAKKQAESVIAEAEEEARRIKGL